MRLLLFCCLLIPIAFSAQDKDSTFYLRAKEFKYRMYDPRLCYCGTEKDTLPKNTMTISPYNFSTNNPLFKSVDDVPDSLLHLLPDSVKINEQNKRTPLP